MIAPQQFNKRFNTLETRNLCFFIVLLAMVSLKGLFRFLLTSQIHKAEADVRNESPQRYLDVSTGNLRRFLSVGNEAACVRHLDYEITCWGDGYDNNPPSGGTTYMTLGDANKSPTNCNIKSDTTLDCFGYDSYSLLSNMPSDAGRVKDLRCETFKN